METTNAVIQVLDELGKKFGLMVDWSQQNIQPYVQDLMARVVGYEFWTNFVWMSFSFLMILLGVFTIIKLWKTFEYEDDRCIIIVFSAIYNVVFVGIFISTIMYAIKCSTLPELIFMDYLQNFIK